jgi:hypothetical protein
MTDRRSGPGAVGTGGGLAILVALGFLAWRTVRDRLDSVLRSWPAEAVTRLLDPRLAVAVVLAGVMAWAALACLVRRRTRRTLASRVSLVVLAADEFDPTEEAVLRAASQLARVRRAVLGWLDVRASAVRLRLDSAGAGRMAYRVEVASRSRTVVRTALASLGDLELREEVRS